jgi:hypothetical protein
MHFVNLTENHNHYMGVTPDKVNYVRELVRGLRSAKFLPESLARRIWVGPSSFQLSSIARQGAKISDYAEIRECWRYGSVAWPRYLSVPWSTTGFVVQHDTDLHMPSRADHSRQTRQPGEVPVCAVRGMEAGPL